MLNTLSMSFDVANHIKSALDKITIDKCDDKVIPTLFFSIAIEHQSAINVLIENNLIGSSCSLLRNMFEAYVKGLWFLKCAKERDFNKLHNDKFKNNFSSLISDLETTGEYEISSLKDKYWDVLNSYTHSGKSQLTRRINKFEIIPNYEEKLITDVLRFSVNCGYNSCSNIAILSKDAATKKDVFEISKKFNLPWNNDTHP